MYQRCLFHPDATVEYCKVTTVSKSLTLLQFDVIKDIPVTTCPFYSHHVFLIGQIYYCISLVVIICRGSATFLFATKIYENSRKPLSTIRNIPNESWHPEVRRFREQIIIDFNALSGMKFFHLTRNVLLTLVGTITTYELFLLQHNTTEIERNASLNCSK